MIIYMSNLLIFNILYVVFNYIYNYYIVVV